MSQAEKEAREGSLGIKESIQKLGNVLLNHSELSVQEATWCLFGFPMREASRPFTSLNTAKKEDHCFLLKDMDSIKKAFQRF